MQVPTTSKEEEVKQEPEVTPARLSQPKTPNSVKEEKPKPKEHFSSRNSNSKNQNGIWAVVIIVAVIVIGDLAFSFLLGW